MMVFQIDPLQDPRWKALIDWHPDASIFHRVEWLQALKSCYGYTPFALTTSAPGSPLMDGLPVCEIKSPLTGRRFVSVPFSDHCQPLVSDPRVSNALIYALTERLKTQHHKYFEIRPITYAGDQDSGLQICNTYHFHRLDLHPSLDLLFKQFDKNSVQRKIRRAERELLRYEEGSSERLLNCFYKLMIMTRRRHGLPPQPLKWFRALGASLGSDLKIRVAFKKDTAVASILTIAYRKSLVYKYGCSDTRYSNLGGNALLFWHAIQDAKAQGVEELDMGRSDLGNEGLAAFKERWGARRSTLQYWRYPALAAKPGPENMIKHVRRLIAIAPDSCLVGLSNLLYRHIG
ncbi:MAG TPA: GNAT family N-acetyltransferase [Candidatus Sulfotelmatobacter sp.]|nr:GNAT family N-acetyltransferase [Candidatus Sulfotelmatobacter sp.]